MAKHRDEDDRPRRPKDEPAGPRRTEAMAQAKDDLDEAKEHAPERYAMDEIDLENEIVGNLNSLDVSNRDPDYEYAWIQHRAHNGYMVQQKLAMSIKLRTENGVRNLPCWEVVNGTMKEAFERKQADGTRVIGDTLLMRCRKNVYQAIQRWEEKKAADRQRILVATPDEMSAVAARGGRGRVFPSLDSLPTNRRGEHLGQKLVDQMKRQEAHDLAKKLRANAA